MNQDQLRRTLKEAYQIDFPDDLFAFWEFAQGVDKDTLSNTMGLRLEGPLQILAGHLDKEPAPGWHLGSRYYDDPPEFVTVLSGVSYYSRDVFEISAEGRTLFEAFRRQLEGCHSSTLENIETDPNVENFRAAYEADLESYNTIRTRLSQYALNDRPEIGDDYLEQYEEVDDEREIVAETFDTMGIVVPPESYQPLSVTDEELRQLIIAEKDLTSIIQEADQALTDGYAGTALQLGKNLWIGNVTQKQDAYRLLTSAYEALDRATLKSFLTQISLHRIK